KAHALDGSSQFAPPIRFTYGDSWRTISKADRQDWGRMPSDRQVFPTTGSTVSNFRLNQLPLTGRIGSIYTIPIDLDGDGLMDILTGPQSCGRPPSGVSRFTWYRNTGRGFVAKNLILKNDFPGNGQSVLPTDPHRNGELHCSIGAIRWFEPL